MAEDMLNALAARLASLGIDTDSAVKLFSAVVETCEQVAEKGRKDYQELQVEHPALRQELDDLEVTQAERRDGIVTDPYFMVLVDGHSHKFLEQHLQSGAKGGFAAVQALRKAVQQYIKVQLPALIECRVIVRVFADLKGLCEEETLTLQLVTGFAAGFSSEDPFADLVDVRDRKVVSQKIEGSLQACMKDAQCQHVLLGARYAFHSTNITEEPQNRDKVSYLKRDMFDDGIGKLRVKSVTFPQAFRAFVQGGSGETVNDIAAKVTAAGACWDYQRDDCTRGKCTYKRINVAEATPSPAPIFSTTTLKGTTSSPTDLPKFAVDNMVPVNAAGQRLDVYMSPPSNAQWSKYKARCKSKKLCNAFHLEGACQTTQSTPCEFDHDPIDEALRHVLRFAAKHRPCNHNSGGSCRRLDCNKGHVCQRPECLAAGKRAQGCILVKNLHGIDYKMHMWVPSTDGSGVTAGNESTAVGAEVKGGRDGADGGVGRSGEGYMPGHGNVAYDLIDLSD